MAQSPRWLEGTSVKLCGKAQGLSQEGTVWPGVPELGYLGLQGLPLTDYGAVAELGGAEQAV